ncbi:MAG: hypothetical protein NTX25_05055 [Proteobacteria bacterium]|nr:hypothetical protein [Pseudomonadota bacterium]
MYKDKHGITDIKASKRDNLSISVDQDIDQNGLQSEKYPVFLYTPSMADTGEHYHIVLRREEAKALKEWLEAYLADTEPKDG